MPQTLRMIGIDPGFGRAGIGIIDLNGNDATHVWHDCIDTPASLSFTERLQLVRTGVLDAIRGFKIADTAGCAGPAACPQFVDAALQEHARRVTPEPSAAIT